MLGPAPNAETLAVTLECTTAPDERFGTPHQILVKPDWTVWTPHDLEAERLAGAFGGWCSCLEVADKVVPAYQHVLEVILHLIDTPVSTDASGTWVESDPAPECHATGPRTRHVHGSKRAALQYYLAPDHLRRHFSVREDLLEGFLRQARQRWLRDDASKVSVVAEPQAVAELWHAGLHPHRIRSLATLAPPSVLPLPADFYLHAEHSGVDHEWLKQALLIYPTSRFACWAAALGPAASRFPISRTKQWHKRGLSSTQAIMALEADLSPSEIDHIVEISGTAIQTIVTWLATWSPDCRTPTAEHYRLLATHHLLHVRPSPDRLASLLSQAAHDLILQYIDRTELTVMLILQPEPARVLRAIEAGARAAHDELFLATLDDRRTAS